MWLLVRLSTILLCIALFDAMSLQAAEPSASAAKSDDQAETSRASSTKKTATPRKQPKKTAAQLKKEAARAKWLELLKKRGVDPWPESETDEEHAAALKKSREMATEVVSLFSGSQLHETQHFIFVSNIPAQQIAPYVASLDRMYDFMCQLYGVQRSHKVWLGGKAPIFAFLEREQFDGFEERYFPESRETIRA